MEVSRWDRQASYSHRMWNIQEDSHSGTYFLLSCGFIGIAGLAFWGKELKPCPKNDGRGGKLGSEAHLGTSPGELFPLCQGQ